MSGDSTLYRTCLVFLLNGMIVALVSYINGNSIVFIRILAGENTQQGRLE